MSGMGEAGGQPSDSRDRSGGFGLRNTLYWSPGRLQNRGADRPLRPGCLPEAGSAAAATLECYRIMNVIIADDHPLVRDSLRGVVKELLPQASIEEAASASEVLSRLDANPDVEMVLLDLVMPGANRFELLETICAEYPELKVVVLSASENPADIRKTLDVGATGFVPKSAAPAVIISAIRLVIDGGVYVPHELLKADPDGVAQQSLAVRSDSPPCDGVVREKSRSSENRGRRYRNRSAVPPMNAQSSYAPARCNASSMRACRYSRTRREALGTFSVSAIRSRI